jgi:CheY-like chemotaxis protein
MPWILVADDDEDLRAHVREVLTEAGYEVRSAADGAEALRLVEESDEVPAVVVLDLLMPHTGGHEALRRLGQSPRTRRVPVVVLSGIVSEDDEVMTPQVSAVLLKPVAGRTLVEVVANAMKPAVP